MKLSAHWLVVPILVVSTAHAFTDPPVDPPQDPLPVVPGLNADFLDGLTSGDLLMSVDEERAARIEADDEERSARMAADAAEAAARIAGDVAEADARAAAIASEAQARAAGDEAEATARGDALAAEAEARIAGDAAEATARTTAIQAETEARIAGDVAEAAARATAIQAETDAREAADAELLARMRSDALSAGIRPGDANEYAATRAQVLPSHPNAGFVISYGVVEQPSEGSLLYDGRSLVVAKSGVISLTATLHAHVASPPAGSGTGILDLRLNGQPIAADVKEGAGPHDFSLTIHRRVVEGDLLSFTVLMRDISALSDRGRLTVAWHP